MLYLSTRGVLWPVALRRPRDPAGTVPAPLGLLGLVGTYCRPVRRPISVNAPRPGPLYKPGRFHVEDILGAGHRRRWTTPEEARGR